MTEAPPPAGLHLERHADGGRRIHWRAQGRTVLLVFLGIWLTIWTLACVALLHGYFTGGVMDDGRPIPFWFVAIFWGSDLLVLGFVLSLLFARHELQLDLRLLTVRSGVLPWRGAAEVTPRSAITGLEIEHHDGRRDASAWSLKSRGRVRQYLVKNQSYERVYWIGEHLAEWLKVDLEID
jgi:hypothetical protein